jgi:eukaryotic translation initiation factor 2C
LVLNCGSAKDKILIPADCLTVLEGNIYRRLLEGEQTKPMQQLASVRPAENKERILNDGRPIFGIGAGDDSDNVVSNSVPLLVRSHAEPVPGDAI